MKLLSRPRHWVFGAALLLVLTVTSCGAPLPGESWAGISTDGKYVYVAYKEQVFRIDPALGGQSTSRQIDWLTQSPNKVHMYAPPAISDDGVLFEGAYDHKVYAFSTTGSGLITTWNSPTATDKIIGGALVHDDLVYVGMGDKGVKALDRKTGTERWTYANTAYGVWSTPVVVDDTLYFASLDHNIYALDAHSGTFKWKVDLGGAIAGKPFYDSDTKMLYMGTFADDFVAVSTDQAKIVNRYQTRGWVWGAPVTHNGTLYFADLAGWVYALDPNTFQLKWEVTDADRPGAIRGSLAIAKNQAGKYLVIAGSESKYPRAYDADTGQVVWTAAIATDDQVLSDLVVIGDDVIFTTLSDKQIVAAYSVETGRPNWRVDLTSEVSRLQTATVAPISTPIPTATSAASPAGTSAATAPSKQ